MDPQRPRAAAVAVAGERLATVGELDEVLAAHPVHSRVDLGGATLLPGFIDAHHHLCLAALHPRYADLSRADSIEDMADELRAAARREPDTTWIRGWGWDETRCGIAPTAADLDAMGLDRPVLVAHYSYHQGVVCSRGLEQLGIGGDTADPVGGEIGRDARGRPDGRLVERAWGEAHAASLASYLDPDRWDDLVVKRARSLWADGIVAVHDAACPPAAEDMYRRLAAQGRLPVSVLAMPHPAAFLAEPDPGRFDGPPTGEGDEWLRVGAAKLFADGGVVPAISVHAGGVPLVVGNLMPGLDDAVRRATDAGFGVAIHALGNRALEVALDACATAERRSGGRLPRPRIEHATLASAAQARRLADLGGAAVVQPGFVDHIGRGAAGFEPDDASWLPFATLAGAGVVIAGSSDDPCALHEPLRTSAYGAHRRTSAGHLFAPAEALAYEEWLRAYTWGAAWAGGQEHERGSLKAGLRADLVVLEGELDPDRPPGVRETWVAGRRVYAAPADTA